ncbi:MAG: IS30 family transposase [Treponema sp.]|nr:IS30 family transposase [Treponema sp.]
MRERMADGRVRKRVEEKLTEEARYPKRVAGRLALDLPVSHETLYQWIYAERRDLIQHLVCGLMKQRKRSNSHKSRVGKTPERRDITERPAAFFGREEAGPWEADTVVSRRSKAAAVVFVERKYRYYIAVTIKDKTAEETLRAAVLALSAFPQTLLKTITFDNGLENAPCGSIDAALGRASYFCKPYNRWEPDTKYPRGA